MSFFRLEGESFRTGNCCEVPPVLSMGRTAAEATFDESFDQIMRLTLTNRMCDVVVS